VHEQQGGFGFVDLLVLLLILGVLAAVSVPGLFGG